MNIPHITPHMGGGVGRVLMNYFAAAPRAGGKFSLHCLDYINDKARAFMEGAGIEHHDRLGRDYGRLAAVMAKADLTVVHFWNHPLLYDFILNGLWPEGRALFWSHVSGHSAPQVFTGQLLDFPDLFAFTTPHSFTAPAVRALSEGEKAAKIRLLNNCGGLDYVGPARRLPHERFRVGYVGTVDYQKMHPDFLRMSLAADLGDAVFTVVGGPHQESLRREAEALGALDRFEFTGPVENVSDRLAAMDIFGYPLNRQHYGTLELALLEAQAMGAPPVVLAGGAEEFSVGHDISGLVVRDEAAYSRALERLYRDGELRGRLSRAGPGYVRERFSAENMVRQFNDLYDELMSLPPRRGRRFGGAPPVSGAWRPFEVFLASQGAEADIYREGGDYGRLSATSFSEKRGSVFHYREFFPEDPQLAQCAARLEKYNSGKNDAF